MTNSNKHAITLNLDENQRISVEEVQGAIEDETGVRPSLAATCRMLVQRGLDTVYEEAEAEPEPPPPPARRIRLGIRD